MDAYDLCAAWESAVAGSAGLAAWIETAFGAGTALTRFVGVDPRDMPGKKDCPFVAFVPVKTTSGEIPDHAHSVLVVLGIKDSEMERSGNRVEYRGIRRLRKEFWPLVESAIASAVNVEAFGPVEIETAMPDNDFHELDVTITAHTPNVLGI